MGRNQETIEARTKGSELPSGNWIHVFDGFSDILNVINAQVYPGLPIEEEILRQLLQRELTEYLRLGLMKLEGKLIGTQKSIIEYFCRKNLQRPDLNIKGSTSVDTSSWDLIRILALHVITSQFQPLILPKALMAGAFLRFDQESGAYRETPLYEALSLLHEEIQAFTKGNTPETMSLMLEYAPSERSTGQQTIEIATLKLISLINVLDRWVNIIELSRAILKHFKGNPFEMPDLRPKVLFKEWERKLEKETVTNEEIEAFISSETGK